MSTQTLGQAVDARGVNEVFALIAELAKKHGRIPAGYWNMEPMPGWRLIVNGTKAPVDLLPPYHARIDRDGLPLVLVNPAEGICLPGTEAEIIAMLREAVRLAVVPKGAEA
jgi:hypothetical protein